MVKNTYEIALSKVDNSIFDRIKNFFRNLFSNNNKEGNIVTKNVIEDKRSFVDNIKIYEKKPNLRLQKMSKDLESGKIIEEDLCEPELQELRDFYLDQIQEKKQSIENYKNRITRIKSQLV